jgi:hypothetical protein
VCGSVCLYFVFDVGCDWQKLGAGTGLQHTLEKL